MGPVKLTHVVVTLLSLTTGLIGQSGCGGCIAAGGAGIVNANTPNDPDENGDTDPVASGTSIEQANIDPPATAAGSWTLAITGIGSEFKSSAGSCKENEKEEPDPEDPPCVQNESCEWKLEPTSAGNTATMVITVKAASPGTGGTTGPNTSSNLVQVPGTNPPDYSATFDSDTPMSPGCGGEIEFAVSWKLAGAEQRWELSFRCTPCRETADEV